MHTSQLGSRHAEAGAAEPEDEGAPAGQEEEDGLAEEVPERSS